MSYSAEQPDHEIVHITVNIMQSSTADEGALVDRARAGDADAWTQLYECTYTPVYRYVRARVFEPAVAEDVASEVFVSAVCDIRNYRPQGKPILAWLFGIAAHRVADYRRELHRQRRLQGHLAPQRPAIAGNAVMDAGVPALTTVGESDAIVARLDLAEAIAQLTDLQREVMILRYFVRLSTTEIGDVIGKDASAVYSLHARALVALRHLLAEEDLAVRDESQSSRAISQVEA